MMTSNFKIWLCNAVRALIWIPPVVEAKEIFRMCFLLRTCLFLAPPPPTKLPESNVLSPVCLLLCLFTVRSHHTWSHPPTPVQGLILPKQGLPNVTKLVQVGCTAPLECFLLVSGNEPLEQIITISIRVCTFSGTAARNPFNFPCISPSAVN